MKASRMGATHGALSPRLKQNFPFVCWSIFCKSRLSAVSAKIDKAKSSLRKRQRSLSASSLLYSLASRHVSLECSAKAFVQDQRKLHVAVYERRLRAVVYKTSTLALRQCSLREKVTRVARQSPRPRQRRGAPIARSAAPYRATRSPAVDYCLDPARMIGRSLLCAAGGCANS
jgi:hypothetical protein